MAVDPSIFNNIHSFQDYSMANQQFLAQQQAAQLDAATKQMVLKGQLIGGAAGTGDPNAIAAAKQHGAALGIDMSDVPDDPQGAVNYANSIINAQKPYALGNAISNAVKTNAAGVTALGSVADAGAAGLQVPVPHNGAISLPMGISAPPQITLPQQSIATQAPKAPAGATFDSSVANGGGQILADMNGGAAPTATPQSTAVTPTPQVSKVPPQPVKTADETPANFNARLAAWQELPEVKAADASATTAAEERAKSVNKQIDSNLGAKDILRLYNKIGTEAPGVPGGIAQNIGANLANAANIPSDAANNRGAFDADLNNLYLATIRSLAGTGRVQRAELQKISEAAPQDNEPTGVKISKVNAHLEDYNQRMKDMGFNPSTGKQLAPGEQPQDVPQVTLPNAKSSGKPLTVQSMNPSQVKGLQMIKSPSDPRFQQLPSGAQFIGPDGGIMVKH